MTVACAEVEAPVGALQWSANGVVVASGSVDVEPRVPVAIRKLSGAKSSQPEVLTLDQMRRDFPPAVTVAGFATSVAYGFAAVDVATGGATGGVVGVVGAGAGAEVPNIFPSSWPSAAKGLLLGLPV